MTTNQDRSKTCPDCGGEIGVPLVCLTRLRLECRGCGREFDSPEAIPQTTDWLEVAKEIVLPWHADDQLGANV